MRAGVDFATLIKSLVPASKFIVLVRPVVATLRSSFWFFNGKNMREYESILRGHIGVLKPEGEENAAVRRCDLLLSASWKADPKWPQYSKDWPKITLTKMPNSCEVAKLIKRFGPRQVFITDATAFQTCQDGFAEWMGIEPCRPTWTKENVHEASKSHSRYSATIAALEGALSAILDKYYYFSFPRLPASLASARNESANTE
jgi:hypothetical protein